jgi:hypothetical protein
MIFLPIWLGCFGCGFKREGLVPSDRFGWGFKREGAALLLFSRGKPVISRTIAWKLEGSALIIVSGARFPLRDRLLTMTLFITEMDL